MEKVLGVGGSVKIGTALVSVRGSDGPPSHKPGQHQERSFHCSSCLRGQAGEGSPHELSITQARRFRMHCIGVDVSKQELVTYDGKNERIFPNDRGLPEFRGAGVRSCTAALASSCSRRICMLHRKT